MKELKVKKKLLHNRVDKRVMKERLMQEPFRRRTVSFYRYVKISDPQEFRDALFMEWDAYSCFGRIYIAREGINAQMSVPEHHWDDFLQSLEDRSELKGMPLKIAIEDDGKSFYILKMKVRHKILADGMEEGSFDVTNVGKHLTAMEFNEAMEREETIVVDMRNTYESEIGRFDGAICPDVDTFREEVEMVVDLLQDKKDKKVLLYCTGGVRCEKASAYLKHHGFTDVNQLHGGVIEYARQVKLQSLPSRFKGKNFVFDERLGERITDDVLGRCHTCGSPADTHANCANQACHVLFIQCDTCREKTQGTCSDECFEIVQLPESIRLEKVKALARERKGQKYSKRPMVSSCSS